MKAASRLVILSLTLLASACGFESAKSFAVRTVASMIFGRVTAPSGASSALRPAKTLDTKPARLCVIRCPKQAPRRIDSPKLPQLLVRAAVVILPKAEDSV